MINRVFGPRAGRMGISGYFYMKQLQGLCWGGQRYMSEVQASGSAKLRYEMRKRRKAAMLLNEVTARKYDFDFRE